MYDYYYCESCGQRCDQNDSLIDFIYFIDSSEKSVGEFRLGQFAK